MNKKSIFFDTSTLLLVGVNLFTIFLAIQQSWGLGELIVVYWCQSVIIGVSSWKKIRDLERVKRDVLFEKSGRSVFEGKGILGSMMGALSSKSLFFTLHFGFFHFVYAIFIGTFLYLSFLSVESSRLPLVALTIVGFLVNHYLSYKVNWPREKAQASIERLFSFPYFRTLPMHITLIFGFVLPGQFGLILFMVLKSLADVGMHIYEHTRGVRADIFDFEGARIEKERREQRHKEYVARMGGEEAVARQRKRGVWKGALLFLILGVATVAFITYYDGDDGRDIGSEQNTPKVESEEEFVEKIITTKSSSAHQGLLGYYDSTERLLGHKIQRMDVSFDSRREIILTGHSLQENGFTTLTLPYWTELAEPLIRKNWRCLDEPHEAGNVGQFKTPEGGYITILTCAEKREESVHNYSVVFYTDGERYIHRMILWHWPPENQANWVSPVVKLQSIVPSKLTLYVGDVPMVWNSEMRTFVQDGAEDMLESYYNDTYGFYFAYPRSFAGDEGPIVSTNGDGVTITNGEIEIQAWGGLADGLDGLNQSLEDIGEDPVENLDGIDSDGDGNWDYYTRGRLKNGNEANFGFVYIHRNLTVPVAYEIRITYPCSEEYCPYQKYTNHVDRIIDSFRAVPESSIYNDSISDTSQILESHGDE